MPKHSSSRWHRLLCNNRIVRPSVVDNISHFEYLPNRPCVTDLCKNCVYGILCKTMTMNVFVLMGRHFKGIMSLSLAFLFKVFLLHSKCEILSTTDGRTIRLLQSKRCHLLEECFGNDIVGIYCEKYRVCVYEYCIRCVCCYVWLGLWLCAQCCLCL
jgi:hypothetical protein